jgi:AcrR family transcriptional regulator
MSRAPELVRVWRGQSPEERVAERRRRILDAALEVFCDPGYQAAKVKDVCREAGLTERYFYESFENKEKLLVSLGARIIAGFVRDAAPSIALVATDLDAGIAGAMHAVVHSLTDDPRRARILFVESVGVSPWVEEQRRAAFATVTQVIVTATAGHFGDWVRESTEVDLTARAVLGASSELVIAYARGELTIDQDQLTEALTRILLRARTVMVAMAAEPTAAAQTRRSRDDRHS